MKAFYFILLLFSVINLADVVVPKSSVTNHVIIRASNTVKSEELGKLHPRESLPYFGSVNRW